MSDNTLQNTMNFPSKPICNCRRTKCQQKYCQCFAHRGVCHDKCQCTGCQNKPTPLRKPLKCLLENNMTEKNRGCNCKRSACKKKSCECHLSGISCGDRCKCTKCQNTEVKSKKFDFKLTKICDIQDSHENMEFFGNSQTFERQQDIHQMLNKNQLLKKQFDDLELDFTSFKLGQRKSSANLQNYKNP